MPAASTGVSLPVIAEGTMTGGNGEVGLAGQAESPATLRTPRCHCSYVMTCCSAERRRYSTFTPKNLAICFIRVSSGVRMLLSHGLHCCGDTPNSFAHFLLVPRRRPYFLKRSALMLRPIASLNSVGTLPIARPFLASRRPKEKGRRERLVGVQQGIHIPFRTSPRAPPPQLLATGSSLCQTQPQHKPPNAESGGR